MGMLGRLFGGHERDEEPAQSQVTTLDQILAQFERLYPGVDGEVLEPRLSVNTPIRWVYTFGVREPRPHWHYIGAGLTDIWGQQDGPDKFGESGWGFELTFRLAAPDTLGAAPQWPARLLAKLGRYVASSGNPLGAGHHMELRRPIDEDSSPLTCLGFIDDPTMQPAEAPSGKYQFVQAFGLTEPDVYDAMAWQALKFYDLLQEQYPWAITVPDRPSLRDDPELAARIDAGRATDGSSMRGLGVAELKCAQWAGEIIISLPGRAAAQIGDMLANALPEREEFRIGGPRHEVIFELGDQVRFHVGDKQSHVMLRAEDIRDIQAHLTGEGEVVVPPGVRWRSLDV